MTPGTHTADQEANLHRLLALKELARAERARVVLGHELGGPSGPA